MTTANKKIICCDIDGVCANLIERWLFEYNRDYFDNLAPENIKSWDTHLYVKEACGKKIYDYIQHPNELIYDNVVPIAGSLESIRLLREYGYRIIFVTAFEPHFSYRKFQWLKDWGFLLNKNDYVESFDKSIIKADTLIDDSYHNVRKFKGKRRILFTSPWNQKYDWKLRANNWDEIIDIIEKGID